MQARLSDQAMERSANEMVLILALLLATFAVCLEGRNIQSEPKPYKPQNFFGFGGIVTSPGLGGGGSGLVPGGFGFGTPIFGSVPIIGSVPAAPGAGLRARRGGNP